MEIFNGSLYKNIKEASSEFLVQQEDDNYTKDYVGVVEDNKDPEKLVDVKFVYMVFIMKFL